MLICSKCGKKQESGKFCEECGNALEVVQATQENDIPNEGNNAYTESAATTVDHNQSQTNETLETAKSWLSQYRDYVVNLLKNPTNTFQSTENHFTNGLVTLILYSVTFSLSIYFLTNSLFRSFMGYFGQSGSISFFSMNSKLIFASIVIIGIAFGSALAMTKWVKHQDNVKTLLSQYSGLVVPFLALNLVAVLGGLTGSVQLTLIPLLLSNIFIATIIPAIFVYEKSSQVNNNGLKVYHSFATILIITVVSYILSNSILNNFIYEMERMFGYF